MGRKAVVPYGLYRTQGFFNPFFGRQTGCTARDLRLFWEALQQMWDFDRSASRGLMACRGLYIWLFASLRPSSKADHTRLKCAFAYCVHFVDHMPSAGSA